MQIVKLYNYLLSKNSNTQNSVITEQHWSLFFDKIQESNLGLTTIREDYTELHVAAFLGEEALCQKLLEKGCCPNEKSGCHYSPLLLALKGQYEAIALSLIEAKADIHSVIPGVPDQKIPDYKIWNYIIQLEFVKIFDYCLAHQLLTSETTHYGMNLLGWIIGSATNSEKLIDVLAKYTKLKDTIIEDSSEYLDLLEIRSPPKNSTVEYEIVASPFLSAIKLEKFSLIKCLLNYGLKVQVIDGEGLSIYTYAKFCNVPSHELNLLKVADNGFTAALKKIRLIGHQFSLKGNLYEGYDLLSATFYKQIHRSFSHHFPKDYPGYEEILEILKQTIYLTKEEALSQILQNQKVILKSGWSGHSVAVLFARCFYKINTGEASGLNSGILAYNWTKQSVPALSAIIDRLLKNGTSEDEYKETAIKYFNKELNHILNLKHIFLINRKQTVGNCHWETSKSTLAALLIDQNLPKKVDITIKDGEKAWNKVKELYKNWVQDDRMSTLIELPMLLKKVGEVIDTEKVLSDILLACLKLKDKPLISRIIEDNPTLHHWTHPKTGKSLPRCLYDIKLFDLFSQYLEEYAFDPYAEDLEGTIFLHDLEKSPPPNEFRKRMLEALLLHLEEDS